MIKCRAAWVFGILLLLASGLATASPTDEESKKTFADLIDQHAASVVRVSFVFSSTMQGQEQSRESSVTGVVIDSRGLVLVPKMIVAPTFTGMDKLSAEQKASFKFETRDFRVHFAGVDDPLEAEALTSDADLGVAWLRLKSPDPKLLHTLDLDDTAEGAPGQAYYVLERLDKKFGEVPILSWGVLIGSITVPRKAYVVTGSPGLALSAEGKVIGYVAMDFDAVNEGLTDETSSSQRLLMSPARKLAAANRRALALVGETAAAD